MALYGTPKFNIRDTIAVGSSLNPPATSFTLTGGNFGSPSGTQILVVDWDNNTKAVVIACTIVGTAVTSVTYLDGAVAANHAAGANVTMAFTPTQYTSVIDGSGWSTTAITLAYATAAADQTLSNSLQDLTSLTSGSITIPGNSRRLEISTQFGFQVTLATFMTVAILEDGVAIWTGNINAPITGLNLNTGTISFTKTPTAGAHTYKIQASNGGAAGTLTLKASSAQNAFILAKLI